jgi:hypothetical protein
MSRVVGILTADFRVGEQMESGLGTDLGIQTTTKRTGGAAFVVPNTNPNNVYDTRCYVDDSDSVIVQMYIYIPTGEEPDEEHAIIVLGDATDTDAYKLTIDNSRQLRIYNVTTQIGNASSALAVDTWHRVAFRADVSASSGSHILQGRLNGTEFAGATNLTMTTSPIDQWRVGWNIDGWNGDQDNGQMFIDDVVAHADSGGGQADWPVDCKLDVLYINADEGTPQGSSSSSNDFYEDVGELNDDPQPDDASSYWTIATNNHIAEGQLQPRTDSDVGSSDTINWIAVYVRMACNASGTASYTARIRGQSTGSIDEGDSRSIGKTTWWAYADQWGEKSPGRVSTINPQDSAAWEASDLDNVCVGLKVTDANPDLNITCVAAVVCFSVSSVTYVELISEAALQVDGESDLDSYMELVSVAEAEVDGESNLTSRVALVSEASLQVDGESDLTSYLGLVSAANLQLDGESSLQLLIDLVSEASLSLDGESNLTSILSLISEANLQLNGLSSLSSYLGLSGISSLALNGESFLSLTGVVDLISAASLGLSGESNLTSILDLVSLSELQVDGGSILSSFLNLTSSANLQVNGESALGLLALLNSVSTLQVSGESNLKSYIYLLSEAELILSGESDLITSGLLITGPKIITARNKNTVIVSRDRATGKVVISRNGSKIVRP